MGVTWGRRSTATSIIARQRGRAGALLARTLVLLLCHVGVRRLEVVTSRLDLAPLHRPTAGGVRPCEVRLWADGAHPL
jgi:hypothetical protein